MNNKDCDLNEVVALNASSMNVRKTCFINPYANQKRGNNAAKITQLFHEGQDHSARQLMFSGNSPFTEAQPLMCMDSRFTVVPYFTELFKEIKPQRGCCN